LNRFLWAKCKKHFYDIKEIPETVPGDQKDTKDRSSNEFEEPVQFERVAEQRREQFKKTKEAKSNQSQLLKDWRKQPYDDLFKNALTKSLARDFRKTVDEKESATPQLRNYREDEYEYVALNDYLRHIDSKLTSLEKELRERFQNRFKGEPTPTSIESVIENLESKLKQKRGRDEKDEEEEVLLHGNYSYDLEEFSEYKPIMQMKSRIAVLKQLVFPYEELIY